MKEMPRGSPKSWQVQPGNTRREGFYRVLMPVLVLVNLSLGVFNLALAVHPGTGVTWVLLGAGAFSCMLGGWLGGAWWLRCYWKRAMSRQVELWHHVVDAALGWTEEVSAPADAIYRLKRRIDRVLSNS
jgi:hypothetical protein